MPPRYLRDKETDAVYPWSESWSKMPNMEPYDGQHSMGMAVSEATVVIENTPEAAPEAAPEVEPPKRRGGRRKGK